METNKILLGVGLLLVIVVTIQTFQIRSLQQNLDAKNQITANGVQEQLDMAGWTENEKMNYEMHGTIPARIGNTGAAAPSMVGGC